MIPAPLRVIRHITPGRIVRTQLPAADLYDLFSDPDSSIDYLKGNSLNPTIRNHQLLFSVGVVIDEWSASSQEAVVVVMQCRRIFLGGKKTFPKKRFCLQVLLQDTSEVWNAGFHRIPIPCTGHKISRFRVIPNLSAFSGIDIVYVHILLKSMLSNSNTLQNERCSKKNARNGKGRCSVSNTRNA